MPLSQAQKDALEARAKNAIARAPAIIRPFIPLILNALDDGVEDIPEQLRDVSVGDIVSAYVDLRRRGRL